MRGLKFLRGDLCVSSTHSQIFFHSRASALTRCFAAYSSICSCSLRAQPASSHRRPSSPQFLPCSSKVNSRTLNKDCRPISVLIHIPQKQTLSWELFI